MKDAPFLHRLEYAAFVPFRWLLGVMPDSVCRTLGRFIGTMFYTVSASRRRTALTNVGIAFPELSPEERKTIARTSFRGFGDALLSTLASSRLSAEELEERWAVEGWEHFAEVAGRGKGLILLSAHIGTWEIAAYPAPLRGHPIHAVGRPPDNPYLLGEMESMRCRFGNSMIAKRGAARTMLRLLRDGQAVGILIDQRAKPNDGELLPFFGRPARTSTLVARMSLRTGAAVVPVFSWRLNDGRWLVSYRTPIEPDSIGELIGEDATMALTQAYLDVTEQAIRETPEKWLWMHDRWRTEEAHPPDGPETLTPSGALPLTKPRTEPKSSG